MLCGEYSNVIYCEQFGDCFFLYLFCEVKSITSTDYRQPQCTVYDMNTVS